MAYGLFSAWRSARSRIDRPYHYLVLTVMLMLFFEDASLSIVLVLVLVLVLGAVAYANMLRAGNDVETVARLGGLKDAPTVLRYDTHAIEDRTLTDALSDTPLTQLGPGEGRTKRL